MVICKFCGEKIEYFDVEQITTGGLSFSLDGYDEEPNERDSKLAFMCPECNKELFCDEEKATDFLKEDDELKDIIDKKIIKSKQEVIDKLKGKRTLKCPKCNHTQFIRKMFDLVEVIDDREEDCIRDELISEGFESAQFICRNCNEDVTEEEMI